MKWCIARPKQGIALNGFEYACYPGSDKVAVFDNPEQAKIAMLYYGIDDAEAEKQGLLIIPYYTESEEGGEESERVLNTT